MYMLGAPQREIRIDEMFVAADKCIPFMVFGHRNRPIAQLLHALVCFIGFPLKDASIGVISLLDFSDND